jgi:hypothetical protein
MEPPGVRRATSGIARSARRCRLGVEQACSDTQVAARHNERVDPDMRLIAANWTRAGTARSNAWDSEV